PGLSVGRWRLTSPDGGATQGTARLAAARPRPTGACPPAGDPCGPARSRPRPGHEPYRSIDGGRRPGRGAAAARHEVRKTLDSPSSRVYRPWHLPPKGGPL